MDRYNSSESDQIVGFSGDCGNWAIAYRRKYGGDLYYLYDENDEFVHVVVMKNKLVIDARKKWKLQSFFEWYCELWDLQEIEELYDEGLRVTSEEQIFSRLPQTTESRILELMNQI